MNAYVPKGRGIPRVKIPQRDGSTVIRSVGSRDPDTIADVTAMLRDLRRGRRWNALTAVGKRQVTLLQLLDAWRGGEAAMEHLLDRMEDVDLEPYIRRWVGWLGQRKGNDTTGRYPAHVRTLIPKGEPFPRSRLTADVIEAWLTGLTTRQGAPLESGTVRRYHAALRSFVGYLLRIQVLTTDPMRTVDAPPAGDARCVFLELPEVRKLLDLADAQHRPLFALIYGTGIEVTTALGLRRRDVDLANREIRARGTKRQRGRTNHRDRMVRVAEWAWPDIEPLLRATLPDALLFQGIGDRWTVSKYHKALVRSEHLARPEIRLHDSRHHWAVRQVRAGTPIELVARQLGHADAVMALKVYGRFRPTAEDRDRWERLAAKLDQPEAQAK